MSSDIEFQNAIETLLSKLTERMQEDVRGTTLEIVTKAKRDRQSAVDAAREAAETRATTIREEAEARIAAALGDAESSVADARKEADKRVAAAKEEARKELERVRTESEAAMAQAAAAPARERDEAIATIREQAESALTASLSEAQSAADQTAEEAKAAARGEAEKALTAEMGQARADAKAGERAALAAVSRLLDSVRRIDAEPGLSAVLDTLTELVAAEAGRVAVFVVQGGSVRGWRFAGFGPEAGEARSLVLEGAGAGFLSRVLEERRALVLPAGMRTDAVGLPPNFASLPDTGQALGVPVLIGGEAMVLVYADDVQADDRTILSQWCEAVELLARHAGHHLEALTAARAARFAGDSAGSAERPAPTAPVAVAASTKTPSASSTLDSMSSATATAEPQPEPPPAPASPPPVVAAPAPTPVSAPLRSVAPELPVPPPPSPGADSEAEEAARRYARLLVSEIKLYNETAVKEGREERNLVERLRSEIDRARSLYEQRIPDTVRSRALFFEQELVRTLADGDPSVLGI